MSTCRNQLMNEGKPYPKSGCQICGSILLPNRLCTKGVLPDPPKGSSLRPEHYVPVGPSTPKDKYAVFTTQTIHHEGDERSRTHPGHGYPAYSENIDSVIKFDSKEALKQWIERNNTGYGRKNFTAIKYQELRVSTSIEVSLN